MPGVRRTGKIFNFSQPVLRPKCLKNKDTQTLLRERKNVEYQSTYCRFSKNFALESSVIKTGRHLSIEPQKIVALSSFSNLHTPLFIDQFLEASNKCSINHPSLQSVVVLPRASNELVLVLRVPRPGLRRGLAGSPIAAKGKADTRTGMQQHRAK